MVKGLLDDLVERGPDQKRRYLVVIDGSKALRAGVERVFGEQAEVQRCQIHKRRNVREYLPVINGHKSLRRDREGQMYLDKVNRLDDYFGGFRTVEIDTAAIKVFIQKEQKRGMSNGSINRSVAALRRMFNLAREENKIRNVPYFPMLKESAPRKGFFEKGQYQSLSVALPDYLRLPLAVGYFTGMRLEEVLALKWDRVDFLTNTINLLAGTTKNDEARTIPVIPQLRVLLLARRAQRQPHCPHVCFRLDPKGHADRINSFRKVWQSRCVKVGLGKMEPAVDRVTGEQLMHPRAGRVRSQRQKWFTVE